MRTRLLLALAALLPGAAAAQKTPAPVRYGPDSAEYLFTSHAESPDPQAPSVMQEIRARLVSTAIGSDSLKVIVTLLDQKVGGALAGYAMELPPPLELRIPRTGYAMRLPDVSKPPTMGPASYPQFFLTMVLPADSTWRWGNLKEQQDSLARAGVKADAHRTQLPDTVIGGNRLVRGAQDMTFTNPGMRSPYDSTLRVPPFHAEVRTERWTDTSGRVFLASMSSHMAAVDKAASLPELTTVMRLERLSP